jgi:hypothetical protein
MEERTLTFDAKDMRVFIGIPCGPSLPWQTVQSVMETCLTMKDMSIQFEVRFVAGCSIVEMARNKVAVEFLRSPANRLFMIDSDMQWKPEAFLQMLALSTKMEVVCAAYRMKTDDTGSVYAMKWDSELTYNDWGCLPVDGVGAGFTVVQRKVVEVLSALAPRCRWQNDPEPIPYLFRNGIVAVDAAGIGDFRGEDMDFFAKAKEIGYQPYLYPSVKLGHIGTKVYEGSIQDAMRPA